PSANWWNGIAVERLHCLVSLHSDNEQALAATSSEIREEARQRDVERLDVRADHQDLSGQLFQKNKREVHFGYTDGISGPEIAWSDPIPAGKVDFRHYVLGFGTDAIQSTPMPLSQMTPALVEAIELASAGTYVALRLMYQDVAAFNKFLDDNARQLAPVI